VDARWPAGAVGVGVIGGVLVVDWLTGDNIISFRSICSSGLIAVVGADGGVRLGPCRLSRDDCSPS
jgi:hypothetical protein